MHKLHMPSFSQTQWTCCKSWSLEWAALTGAQPCTVLSCKDFCGSTALGMPVSEGMNGQADWQAQQASHLVSSLARQRCLGTFWTWTGESITVLITWKRNVWRKEAADIPSLEVGNDLCSIRLTLLFWGKLWGDCWETGRSVYRPFRVLHCHAEQKLN